MIIAKWINQLFYIYDDKKRKIYCFNGKLAKRFIEWLCQKNKILINVDVEQFLKEKKVL